MTINGSDEPLIGDGATHIAVGDHQGKVILRFPISAAWMDLEPGTAVEVAKRMINAAVTCGARISIQAPRQKVHEATRERMIARTVMMLRNKRESPERDSVLAQRIVDTCLNILDL